MCEICHNRFAMSSDSQKKYKEFAERLKKIFKTDKPKMISKELGISYQAARNYLNGERLPDSKILLVISSKTSYSIHWLLTGEGEKVVDKQIDNKIDIRIDVRGIDSPSILADLSDFFVSHDFKNEHTSTDSPKTVTLSPDKTWEEKEQKDETSDLPVNPS